MNRKKKGYYSKMAGRKNEKSVFQKVYLCYTNINNVRVKKCWCDVSYAISAMHEVYKK